MNYVLGFVFLLCLMLLVMIFGEKLSVFGAFHGRWISALGEGMADLWDFVCVEIDRAWCFVLKNLSWVLAVLSGGIGLTLVAWMIFGGVVDHAAADLAAHSGRIDAGGILDSKTAIESRLHEANSALARTESPVPRLIHQVSSPGRPRFNWEIERPTEPQRDDLAEADTNFPPLRDFGLRDFDNAERDDRPLRTDDLRDPETLWPELYPRSTDGYQDFSRWTLERDEYDLAVDAPSTESLAETRVTISGALKREIEFALERLRFVRDSWKKYDQFSLREPRETGSPWDTRDDVPEATAAEVEDVESAVRILAGPGVSESELRIETQTRETGERNEFQITVNVTNQSRQQSRMSGLLVRETLPLGVKPSEVMDGGVYRDSTVTWAIDDLRPRETRSVRVLVRVAPGRTLTTNTEVSAVAAVSSQVEVIPEASPRTDFPTGTADVQFRMGTVPREADLAQKIEITFGLRNAGDATADEALLRVELPQGLDHFSLRKEDIDRNVFVKIRDLKAGQTKNVVLRVRPLEVGTQTAIVELLQDGQAIDLQTFSIRVREQEEEAPDLSPLLPSPDPISPTR